MKLTGHVVGINTEKLNETRDFYVRHFGFEVDFDGEWYKHLKQPSTGLQLGLLQPGHDSQPAVFQGRLQGGVWLALEVDDVDAEYQRFREALPIEVDLRDEPWGERHFVVLDPNGIGVNVMKMTHAAAPAVAS